MASIAGDTGNLVSECQTTVGFCCSKRMEVAMW